MEAITLLNVLCSNDLSDVLGTSALGSGLIRLILLISMAAALAGVSLLEC